MTAHWKLPHDEALGTVRFCDAQVPIREVPLVGVADPPAAVSAAVWVGDVTLVWCWNPQALDRTATAASARYGAKGVFIVDLVSLMVPAAAESQRRSIR
jgi:hypothetical protein